MKTIDENLHLKFVKLGNDHRRLTNELLALLPEIYERGIFKKYAGTIIEYAGKFGGLTKGVVLKRLRLEKHLQNKPLLKESIRTEGVHKVALIAALATPETEKAWISKIENMSKAALQELSKKVRSRQEEVLTKRNADVGLSVGLGANLNTGANNNFHGDTGDESGANLSAPCKAVSIKITLELDPEMTFLFLSLKRKIGNHLGNREIMKKILEMAAAGCANASNSKKETDENQIKPKKVIPGDNFTRHIPVHLKRAALTNANNQCSYPNCNRPPEIFHHPERFSLNQNHKSIIPLCKIHHEFAHNGLILNENQHSSNWHMQPVLGSPGQYSQPSRPTQADTIDHLYKRKRRLAIACTYKRQSE